MTLTELSEQIVAIVDYLQKQALDRLDEDDMQSQEIASLCDRMDAVEARLLDMQ
jgi:hypothetical protein